MRLSGSGLCRYDTVFIAEGSKGMDLVTALLGVPPPSVPGTEGSTADGTAGDG